MTMAAAIKKLTEKVLGKIAELPADIIEPLLEGLFSLTELLDIDKGPEIKIKFMRVMATDHETKQKEEWVCIGFRRVELQ